MIKEDMAFANKVLTKGIKEIRDIAESIEEKDACYETTLKATKIVGLLKLLDVLETMQELDSICQLGKLETIFEEDNIKHMEREKDHDIVVDNYNNKVAQLIQDWTTDILSEDRMNEIATEIQLEDMGL